MSLDPFEGRKKVPSSALQVVDEGHAKEEDDDGTRSVHSDFSVRTDVVARHSQGDAASLKAALKEFVQGLVRGREVHQQLQGGGVKPLKCSMPAEVDALLLGDEPQRVPFEGILRVHHGLEALPLDLKFTLDANVVVLEQVNGSCISLHLGHEKAATEFVLFLRLLTAMQRQQSRPTQACDDDDAKSECSVQTATCQKQLRSAPLSSAANSDPKEVKKMFKMFTQTMKRGRDFYVMRPDGQLYDVECGLSQNHSEFRMRWDFQSRVIHIQDLLSVRTAKEAAGLGLGFPLDDRCATMELQSGECITFKFGHSEALGNPQRLVSASSFACASWSTRSVQGGVSILLPTIHKLVTATCKEVMTRASLDLHRPLTEVQVSQVGEVAGHQLVRLVKYQDLPPKVHFQQTVAQWSRTLCSRWCLGVHLMWQALKAFSRSAAV